MELGFALRRYTYVEYWDRTCWRRTDPEQLRGVLPLDLADVPTGAAAPFQTAAEVWRPTAAATSNLAALRLSRVTTVRE